MTNTLGGHSSGRALVCLVAAVALLCGVATRSAAQISGAAVSTAGSAGSGNNADGSTTFGAAIQINNGTTLKTRYEFNVNSDTGVFSTDDQNGTASHTVTFNVTTARGYRLDITEQRIGDLNRISDAIGCDGNATLNGLTGSSDFPLSIGTLSLGDPGAIGNGGSTTSTPFSQSSGLAQIVRASNGIAQSHALTFTWSASTRSNSCEAAVRIGADNGTTTGCTGCEYPGSPARTKSTDGHFVSVTIVSLCGNGIVEPGFGEVCDQGAANGTSGSCCLSNCTLRMVGQTCRPASGDCDVAEVCDGVSATCPTNGFANNMVVCRAASAGMECDFSETCTGSGPNCPPDIPQPNGFVCRPMGGVCDLAEVCDGVSKLCPMDIKSTAVCRPQNGVCDVAESCNGISNNCPMDGFASSSIVCRSAVDVCDQTENCPGSGPNCPPDGLKPNGTACPSDGNPCSLDQCNGVSTACQHPAGNAGAVCRAQNGDCDVAEQCDGASTTCPADGFASSSTVCRAATPGEVCDEDELCPGSGPNCPADDVKPSGTPCRTIADVCDVQEDCDGVSKFCPADAFEPSSTECRASADVCDVAENCTGSGAACPPDGFVSSSTPCRPSVGGCDPTENCPGSGPSCPPDALQPNGFVCRPGAGVCDVAEQCDGVSAACPADGFASSSTPCRPSTGVCDVVENCTGSGAACPADLFQPDGTSCPDPLFCNGAEECMTGLCQSGGAACGMGQSCDESADLCFTGGCPANAVSCRTALKSILIIKDKVDDTKDKLIWKWIKGASTTQAEFANPTTTANYALCFYAGPTESLIGNAEVPPSLSKWSVIGTKGYKYKDKPGSEDGIQKVIVKGSTSNKSKAIVKGKGTLLPDFTLPVAPGDLPVIVQLRNNETGICWEGQFATPIKNQAGLFKDKTP